MIAPALFLSFLSPEIYSIAALALASLIFMHRGFRGGPPLPEGSGSLLAVFLIMAMLAVIGPTFIYGGFGRDFEAFKFFIAAAMFFVGINLGLAPKKEAPILTIFFLVLTVYYATHSTNESILNQDALLYPPDNNHTAAMVAAFLPLVVTRTKGRLRFICLALLIALAAFVSSRALLALTVVSFAVSLDAVRKNRFILAIFVATAVAILLARGLSLGNFSDQLRLQIIQVSLDFARTGGAHAFNFGEAAFTNFLNVYPIYRRLEIQHAHNMLLQIWAAYGVLPLLALLAFLANVALKALRLRNQLTLLTLGIIIGIGMIESLITDIRAFGTIMFALGYSYSRGRPIDAMNFNSLRRSDTVTSPKVSHS
ncbi:hypothetical protein [Erythrobacter sp. QSSC1-22B]|uniref:hypothetical protein n=1 Tax=Erythrobacter sp. QSSC1-22B TaxID=1860125 RepID=UPI00143B0AAD|nr:hypothetical protein [Erythrobacter sp. QSSC1-22B]